MSALGTFDRRLAPSISAGRETISPANVRPPFHERSNDNPTLHRPPPPPPLALAGQRGGSPHRRRNAAGALMLRANENQEEPPRRKKRIRSENQRLRRNRRRHRPRPQPSEITSPTAGRDGRTTSPQMGIADKSDAGAPQRQPSSWQFVETPAAAGTEPATDPEIQRASSSESLQNAREKLKVLLEREDKESCFEREIVWAPFYLPLDDRL